MEKRRREGVKKIQAEESGWEGVTINRLSLHEIQHVHLKKEETERRKARDQGQAVHTGTVDTRMN